MFRQKNSAARPDTGLFPWVRLSAPARHLKKTAISARLERISFSLNRISSSFPRKREPRSKRRAVALGTRLRGGDEGMFNANGKGLATIPLAQFLFGQNHSVPVVPAQAGTQEQATCGCPGPPLARGRRRNVQCERGKGLATIPLAQFLFG
jgi:hypothetical protein